MTDYLTTQDVIKTTEYERAFNKKMRGQTANSSLTNEVSHSNTGTFMLPEVEAKKFNAALLKQSIFRNIATVIKAPKNESIIRTVDSDDIATWLGDDTLTDYVESSDKFNSYSIDFHRLGTIIRISTDFVNDAGFDIGDYLAKSFAKRIGTNEELAFVNGNGVNMPIGILDNERGADVGVLADELTYDSMIELFFSLKPEYRRNAKWMMNDGTALKLRTIKDANGNYVWNHSNDTILGKPVLISNAMPNCDNDKRPVAFGDFDYYYIVQRLPFTVFSMKEKYSLFGQIGYLGYEHLDAKLIRPEAIKTINITAAN